MQGYKMGEILEILINSSLAPSSFPVPSSDICQLSTITSIWRIILVKQVISALKEIGIKQTVGQQPSFGLWLKHADSQRLGIRYTYSLNSSEFLSLEFLCKSIPLLRARIKMPSCGVCLSQADSQRLGIRSTYALNSSEFLSNFFANASLSPQSQDKNVIKKIEARNLVTRGWTLTGRAAEEGLAKNRFK